jgi:hypothetical protein
MWQPRPVLANKLASFWVVHSGTLLSRGRTLFPLTLTQAFVTLSKHEARVAGCVALYLLSILP